jgi:drug/metabolite transporter (DMT)-like permease
MTRIRADILILIAAVIWGVAFVFQKTAMDHMGPFLFIASRSIIAAITLAPLAFYAERSVERRAGNVGDLSRIALLGGVLFFLGAAAQQAGLQTATVTNTGFLTGLYVVFTPLVAWFANRVAPTTVVWPAIAASFLGAWLLGGGSVSAFSAGDGLVALSSIFWAAHVVTTGRASAYGNAALFTAIQFSVVAVLALACAFSFETVSLAQVKAAWVEIAYVGLLSSALTFTLLTIAMRHTPPAEAAIIASLEMVVAAMAGYWLLGERLGALGLMGGALMLLACVIVQLGPWLEARRARVMP